MYVICDLYVTQEYKFVINIVEIIIKKCAINVSIIHLNCYLKFCITLNFPNHFEFFKVVINLMSFD